jgi:uncharacterized repeat protein (TIGR01451 family)
MPVFTNGVTGPAPICVDYDGDNIGPLTDSQGLRYDQLLSLNQFQSARVFDSDGDQTGMILYVCNLDPSAILNVKLAAAWGQDPTRASASEPGLDLGTTAPPAASFAVGKAADLFADRDNDGNASPGDTLLYTIVIRNTARVPLDNVILRDDVPLHTTYVLNTTVFNNNGSVAPLADKATGTPFPLDEGGVNLGTLPVRGVFTVTFQALIDNPIATGVNRIRNVAIVTANDEEKQAEVETPIDLDPILTIQKLTNGEDGQHTARADHSRWRTSHLDLHCAQHRPCHRHQHQRDRQCGRRNTPLCQRRSEQQQRVGTERKLALPRHRHCDCRAI